MPLLVMLIDTARLSTDDSWDFPALMADSSLIEERNNRGMEPETGVERQRVGPHGSESKDKLLERLVKHVQNTGFSDWSLRGCAKAVGVAPNTLTYYFGSREGLLQELLKVFRDSELRQTEEAVSYSHGVTLDEVGRELWKFHTDVKREPLGVLLVEMYALSLRNRGGYTDFTREVVERWLALIGSSLEHFGYPSERIPPASTLFLGAFRGLYLDLLGSGETARERVDAGFLELLRLIMRELKDPQL